MKELDHCLICPRNCGINRNAGFLGYCGSDAAYHIASICIHRGEEPTISGPLGICNVFFSRCNMHCIFCQNYQISRHEGFVESKTYTLEEITSIIAGILDQGIDAVGFVTPSHFSPHVTSIISSLKARGYQPITVYNTSGYDKPRIIKSLEGLIDVFLPDFKYLDPRLAKEFSDTEDYPAVIRQSILEMYRQKGPTVVLNDRGQAVSGLIIRHLVLPGQVEDSIEVLRWIASELSPSVSISLMSQYYPTACMAGHPVLGRKITAGEYDRVLEAMEELGFTNGWIQHPESADTYAPDFGAEHPFE